MADIVGTPTQVPEHVSQGLERFICSLYGNHKITSVNNLRNNIFLQKFEKRNKIIDLSLLPPCEANLKYHIMRAFYVALMFRNANQLILSLEDPINHGWDERGRVKWSTTCYPDDISQLIINHAEDEENTAFLHDIIDFEDDFDDVLEAEEG